MILPGQALPYLSALWLSHIGPLLALVPHKAFSTHGPQQSPCLHGVWLGRWSAGCIAKLGGSMQPCRFDKLALSNAARQSSEEAVILALH